MISRALRFVAHKNGAHLQVSVDLGTGGGGVLPNKLGGGVRPTSQNP